MSIETTAEAASTAIAKLADDPAARNRLLAHPPDRMTLRSMRRG